MKTITRNITLQELPLSSSSEMLSSVSEISGNAFATLNILNYFIVEVIEKTNNTNK